MITRTRRGVSLGSRLLFAVVLLSAATLAATRQAQAAGSSIEGHWSLVSVVTEKDGKKSDTMGPNPLGLFIFDPSGRYAFQLYRSDLPKIASNARDTATPDEKAAIFIGSFSHYGTYTVDEKEGIFTIRPAASTLPNWVGQNLKRTFSVSGDELKIFNPASSRDPSARAYLVFTRAK